MNLTKQIAEASKTATARTETGTKNRERSMRAFTLACHLLKFLVHRNLTMVELAAISGCSYHSALRIIKAGRKNGLIKVSGYGTSNRGTKPFKYTLDI